MSVTHDSNFVFLMSLHKVYDYNRNSQVNLNSSNFNKCRDVKNDEIWSALFNILNDSEKFHRW